MVLVDTSVWIQLFRADEPVLSGLLEEGLVVMHPFVLGELACGNLKSRALTLRLLAELPVIEPVSHDEAIHLLEHHELSGRGLGWIDVHLLASAMVAHTSFLTLDRRLAQAALTLGLSH